jgi:hypothetical protein
VGQSPIAGQLITEIFNVDSPINAKAIRVSAKKLGINSVDAFFAAFAEAAQRNQGLASVTESIGTRFDKIVDRVQVALRPLGLSIINAIEPFVEPVAKLVERLGSAFDSLSTPVKTAIIVMGGLAAAAGPVLFLMGSVLQSIGQIVPALVTLNAIGLLPTLTNLRLIGQVMAGTASLAAGASATAAVAAGGWVLLGVALAAAAIAGAVAIHRLITAEKELVQVSTAQIKATSGEIKSLREQLGFVDSLRAGVTRTANEQDRLRGIYAKLNPESRARVESIKDETARLVELRTELSRLLTLRTQEQRIQAATLSANLDQTIRQAEAAEAAIDRATNRINALSRAREQLERSIGPLTRQQTEALGLPDLQALSREQQLELLGRRIKSLIKLQDELRTKADQLNGTAREQSEVLKSLAEQNQRSERQILEHAKSMGLLKTDVDSTLKSIEAFRARQAEAAKETKDGTKEIDEQTKSLKELKRALKEAEIATRERSAATRRSFEEDKISSQEATRRLIADARQLAASQIKELDETLEAKRKEAETADEETAEKLREEIGDLELRKRQIASETAIEIADLSAQQRRRERDGEREHQTTLLDIRRTSAEQQIDGLRDRIEREETFRLRGEQQIVVIERRVTQAEEDEIRRRLDLVAAGTEERRRLEDELTKFVADKARQRAEQARRLAKAELDAALLPVRRQGLRERPQDAADAGVISRLQAIADEGRASFETTERQVGKIIDDGFARRIKRLSDEIIIRNQHNQDVSELNAELQVLEQERQNAAEETDRATEQGRQADLGRARSYRDQLASVYAGVAEITFELRERVIAALRRGLGNERQIIDEENKLAVAREQLRHTQVVGAIQENIDRLEALARKRALNAQELKELKAHREALKAESDLTRSNQEEIERQRKIDLELSDPISGRSLLGDIFADTVSATGSTLQGLLATGQSVFSQLSSQAGTMRDIMVSAFSAIGQAVGDAAQSFVLYGNSGTSIKKFSAQVIAGVAAMAATKAIFELAEGFAALARGIFGDPKAFAEAALHFKSAAIYGAVAGVAALAGRAVAGNSFKDNRGTASAAINEGQPKSREFQFGGNAVEPSSIAAREGSAAARTGVVGVIKGLVEEVKLARLENAALTAKLDNTLSRIGSLTPGDVVTIGAADASGAIGAAVVQSQKENNDISREMATNMGF